MRRLRILYLGALDGTCRDRAEAYRRLGHEVEHIDPRRLLPATPWVDRITWRVGGHLFGPRLAAQLSRRLAGESFDLCHVDRGEWVTLPVVELLRRHAGRVVNYNTDDPLGPRDGRRFTAYRRALPGYDLAVVARNENIDEARRAGARAVLRVFHSADEVAHAPRPLADADRERWSADVLFIGTWMPERGPFLLELVRLGVPLTIRGPGWRKAPEWPLLACCWKGDGVGLWGDDYAKAIQCARINLGLVSKGNRDLHTTRSLEIPALGGLLCAERTSEHQSMYADGDEAVFWSSAAECAAVCGQLLGNETRRAQIAVRGHARLHRNAHLNEPILARVLTTAGLDAQRQTSARRFASPLPT